MSKSGSRGCSFLVYSVSCFIFLPLFLFASTSQKHQEFSAAAREVLHHTSMYQYNCLVMAIINSSTCSPSPSPSSSSFHGTSICKRATLKQPTLHSLHQFSSIPKSYRRSQCPELKEDGTALLATSFGIRAYKDATTTDVAASHRFNILPRLCIILRLHKPRTQLATMLLLSSSSRHTNRRRRRRMHPSNSRDSSFNARTSAMPHSPVNNTTPQDIHKPSRASRLVRAGVYYYQQQNPAAQSGAQAYVAGQGYPGPGYPGQQQPQQPQQQQQNRVLPPPQSDWVLDPVSRRWRPPNSFGGHGGQGGQSQ